MDAHHQYTLRISPRSLGGAFGIGCLHPVFASYYNYLKAEMVNEIHEIQ